MGTRFELAIAAGAGDLRAAAEAALEEIEEWHRRLSRFAPDSLLSHVNRTAAASPVRLDAETFALVDEALAVWRATGGAFDPTVAPLLERHGFAASAAGGDVVDAAAVELDAQAWTIRFTRPGVTLDLGGIAKGHALDRAARVLRDAGVTAAIAHGGTSSVVAIGRPPGQPGWRVALGPGPGAPVEVLADRALAVSRADSQRGDAEAGHVMDPRRGAPVAGGAAVAVTGPSARLADAWATALVVLGAMPATWPSGYDGRFLPETT